MSARQRTLLPVLAAIGALSAAAPSAHAASTASGFKCSAVPIAGSVLGQALPLPIAGSNTEDCANDSVLPALSLPGPLSELVSVDVANGTTKADSNGVSARAGLADVEVGSIPVQLPPIPVPDALRNITLVPGVTVDLSPAIQALRTLPSKKLLEASALYSEGTGSCDGTTPRLSASSDVAAASVLGLEVDPTKLVDRTLNLVDTTNIALNSLDLTLATVSFAGQTVQVTPAGVAVLRPILAQLPPIQIPAQVAQVKLTPSSQTTVDGLLVQSALRAQVSLAGRSLADLTVGTVVLGKGKCTVRQAAQTPQSPVEGPAPEEALACTKRKLALIDVFQRRNFVRLYGAADKSLAGRIVKIRFQATGRIVARARVRKNGGFTAKAPLPALSVRNTNRARYVARVGGERSLNLKLTRRMKVTKVVSKGKRVIIRGRVILPLASPVHRITLKRRVTCKKLKVIKRFKPKADGTFRVSVRKPKSQAATVYRLQTRVRNNVRNPKTYPTFTLPRAVDL